MVTRHCGAGYGTGALPATAVGWGTTARTVCPMPRDHKSESWFSAKHEALASDETLHALRATTKAEPILKEIAAVLKELPSEPRGFRKGEWADAARAEEALGMLKAHSKALTDATGVIRLLADGSDRRKALTAANQTAKDLSKLHFAVMTLVNAMDSTAKSVESSKMPPDVALAKKIQTLRVKLRDEVHFPLKAAYERWDFIWRSAS